MSDVFISYRRKDDWIMANLLYEKLCYMGYDVFLDTRYDEMLKREYETVIRENLQNIKDHLILISKESFNVKANDLYLKEIEQTGQTDSVNQIPILIETDGQNVLANCLSKSDVPCLAKLGKKTVTGFSSDAAAFTETFDRIIGRLTSRPSPPYTILTSRHEIENKFSLKERWKNAKEICICAFGIESILTQESPFVEQMIDDGVKFRIVCVDPDSASSDYIGKFNIREGPARKRQRVLPNSHNAILDYLDDEKYAKQIEYRLTSLRPECMIMIVKRRSGENTVKVDFIVTSNDTEVAVNNSLSSKNRRCAYIEEKDEDNYTYYNEVFEFIWNHSCTRRVN